MTAVNTTIAYNLGGAGGGAGLYVQPGTTATLVNCIIAQNVNFLPPTYSAVPDDIGGGPVSSASANNLIGSTAAGGLSNGMNGNLVGVSNPGIGGLANNGGSTQTIALLPGSRAIGMGSTTIPGVVFPTTDQRGFTRPGFGNGVVDIGAFESPVFGAATTYTVNVTTDTDPTSGGSGSGTAGDLRYCINQANVNSNPAGSKIVFDLPLSDAGYVATGSWTITTSAPLELSEASGPEVIQGPGASLTTIRNGRFDGYNFNFVFQVDSATTATISGLTITGGPTNDVIIDGGAGINVIENGGIDIELFGTLTIDNCAIVGNASGALAGGGITNSGWLVVENSTIAGNQSMGSGGGIGNFGTLTVLDSTIADNFSGGVGGGIANSGTLTAVNTTIAYNFVRYGGGPTENATTVMGGGLYNDSTVSSVILDNCIVALNTDPSGADDVAGSGALRGQRLQPRRSRRDRQPHQWLQW